MPAAPGDSATKPTASSGGRMLLNAAAFVVIVAGMRSARTLLVPFLLSVFLAVISGPALRWLKDRGIPGGLAVCLVVGALLTGGMLAGRSVGASITDFTLELPDRVTQLNEKTSELGAWIEERGFFVSQQPAEVVERPVSSPVGAAAVEPESDALATAPAGKGLADVLKESFDPGRVFTAVGDVINELGGLLANAFLILLTVVFILLEASGFPAKLRVAREDPWMSFAEINDFLETVHRYMAIKTAMNLVTGVAVGSWLAFVGVPDPVLWGLLAFVLNYVPSLGAILAAIPAVLLAWITLGDGGAALAAVGCTVINVAIGNVIEPRLMGRRLGLSALVVFLSLVFWGWVLGPVGMLLSVPLTMTIKLGLLHNEETRWIAVLLGSGSTTPEAPTSRSASESRDASDGARAAKNDDPHAAGRGDAA